MAASRISARIPATVAGPTRGSISSRQPSMRRVVARRGEDLSRIIQVDSLTSTKGVGVKKVAMCNQNPGQPSLTVDKQIIGMRNRI